MIKTILFDLDDTLLGNSMDTFIPHYFALLETFTKKHFDAGKFMPAMMRSVEVMARNTDPKLTNNEVFWQEMGRLTGINGVEVEPLLNGFYRGEFNQLQRYTKTLPATSGLVQTCFRTGYEVVIATNPMFPRTAVEARLNWAGTPVTDFPYNLVTTIENMHATKPHQEYYREILAEMNSLPQETLMVGDDWQRDIEPVASLGLFTYWIQLPGKQLPDTVLPSAYGSLAQLLTQVESGWLQRLTIPTSS